MKKITNRIIFVLLILILVSCEKHDSNDTDRLIGNWVTIDLADTFYFITNSRLERPRGYFNDWYEYSCTNQSLTIQYSGPDKIYLSPITSKYVFVNDILIIDFKENYHPDIKCGLKKFQKLK